jgi:hypothetical protein
MMKPPPGIKAKPSPSLSPSPSTNLGFKSLQGSTASLDGKKGTVSDKRSKTKDGKDERDGQGMWPESTEDDDTLPALTKTATKISLFPSEVERDNEKKKKGTYAGKYVCI